ncbi:uncharacterized protein [Euphorbia lathyris]|uniref:uncharacterized protein n=1 Tax=Euphorbia lathyris TaxID=212925 RepID=UPI0033141F09
MSLSELWEIEGDIWQIAGISAPQVGDLNFADWLLTEICGSNQDTIVRICCALKTIWDHRNRVLWHMIWWPADTSWRIELDEVRDWRAYHQGIQPRDNRQPDQRTRDTITGMQLDDGSQQPAQDGLVEPAASLPCSTVERRQQQLHNGGTTALDPRTSSAGATNGAEQLRQIPEHRRPRPNSNDTLHTAAPPYNRLPVRTLANQKWKPPDSGSLKCNIDGAIFKELGSSGMGAVIRDEVGTFLFCSSSFIPSTKEPRVIEALAIRTSMIWLATMRYTNVEFESDAKMVVDAIQSEKQDISEFGSLIHDCRAILRSNSSFKLSFISRLANRAAHLVARQSCSNASDFLSTMVPDWLSNVIVEDANPNYI